MSELVRMLAGSILGLSKQAEIGIDGAIEGAGQLFAQAQHGSKPNHRGVIGAKLGRC